MYVWIEDHLLFIVAILAAMELLYIAAQVAFAAAITHPPYRRLRLWYIALVFMIARRAALVELVMRLFPLATPKKREDQLTSVWRLWHRVHLPAYAARVCRRWPQRQRRVIQCTFLGLKAAVTRAIEEAEPRSEAESRISFDEFWPVLECIEELAVHTHPQNNDAFAKSLAEFVARIDDSTVQAQVGWIVNELLERTDEERALGLAVGHALLNSDAVVSHEALRTLFEYNRIKHADREQEGAPETEDPFIKELEDAAGIPRPVTRTTSTFTASCEALRQQALRVHASAITQKVNALATEATRTGANKDAVIAQAMEIAALTDPLLQRGNLRSGVGGIVSLAAVRLVLRRLCVSVNEPPTLEPKSTTNLPSSSLLIRAVCDALMARRGEDVAGFILIESIESVRDKRPSDAADAMARFLGNTGGRLDPGIAVCICEGVEDHLNKIDPSQRASSVRQVRLRYRRGMWQAVAITGTLGEIETFWALASTHLNGSTNDVAHWMNGRLGLRT